MLNILKLLILTTILLTLTTVFAYDGYTDQRITETYEKILIELMQKYKLPALSVAILAHQQVIYANGFGFADMESKIVATDTTPYRIASVTKPIASVIILKLVANGLLQLDGKLKDYWPDYVDYFDTQKKLINEKAPQFIGLIEDYHYERGDITLRQQLSHTSEGIPGEKFKYSGYLYSQLSELVDKISDRNFHTLVKEDIILNLAMDHSLPQQSDTWRPAVSKILAKPYYRDGTGKLVPGEYPKPDLGAGAGIVSCVSDLAKFDIALDKNLLISGEMKSLAFAPTKLNDGTEAPYGLGWFIGSYKDHKIVYHTGWQPKAFSALYLKVPGQDYSLILLANSEDLIAPFMDQLGAGQIAGCPFAKYFLDLLWD